MTTDAQEVLGPEVRVLANALHDVDDDVQFIRRDARNLPVLAQRILAAMPDYTIVKRGGLDEAWAAAEAVLPSDHVYFGLTHPNPTGSWWATVHGPTVTKRCDHGVEHEAYPRENGYGPTPAAALRALREKLGAPPEGEGTR